MALLDYTILDVGREGSRIYSVENFLYRMAGSARQKNQPLKCKNYGTRQHCPGSHRKMGRQHGVDTRGRCT